MTDRKRVISACLLPALMAACVVATPANAKDYPRSGQVRLPAKTTAALPRERALASTVVLYRGNARIALGVVVAPGMVLTSLSAIGFGTGITGGRSRLQLRPMSVFYTHRGWDLAILAGASPDLGQAGFQAAAAAAVGPFQYPLAGRMAPAVVQRAVRATGADNTKLFGVFQLAVAPEGGTPIFDKRGKIAAIVGRACVDPRNGCARLTRVGIPAATIRQFIIAAGPHLAPAANLGIRAVAAQDAGVFGVRILSIKLGTRAARAGLISRATGHGGDLIVAVAGQPTTTELAFDQSLRAAGSKMDIELIVYRNRRYLRILVPRRPTSAVASFDRHESEWPQLVGEAMDPWSPLDRRH